MNGHRPSLLQALLAINAMATFAAAVFLLLAPAAIPATVGIPLDRSQFFIAYLLSACELGLSVMAAFALRARRDAVGLAVLTLSVMHLASGVGGVIAVAQGASFLILWNALARVVVVALLLSAWFSADKRIVWSD
jgi:hypothetical protein